MAHQIKAKILQNKSLKNGYFHLFLEAPKIAKQASPGQFVNIKITDTFEPLLRRPLGIHRIARMFKVEVIYEVVGIGTEILSRKKPGEYLDVIGPLGNGFDYRSVGLQVNRSAVLVAGGMGVAPLIFLAEKLINRKPLVLIGAKTKHKIICEKEFKTLGCEVNIATDDGSRGFKGKVTELLKNILGNYQTAKQRETIYACGPKPMLKEINFISKHYNIPAQVSLEEHMACGIGACLGCVVNTKDGFKRVCKEGPVFNADEIIW